MFPLRKIAAAALLLALIAPDAAQAAEPLLNWLVRNDRNWFRVNLIDGRLTMKAQNWSPFERPMNSGGVKELLRFRRDDGKPALFYEQTTDSERLTIDLSSAGNKVCIRRLPREKSTVLAVEFKQSPKEKTSLTLGSGDRQQVYRAADLWRLVVAQPKECEEHLFPLLGKLRPDWKLAEMAADVERHLLEVARENAAADHAHWAALVEQLGDDHFAKREAADRALRTGGAVALRYLRQLDFAGLDAEQQFRVRRIIAALAGTHEDDSPDEVAASLAADPLVWLALLGRPEAAIRRTAAQQIAALLGEPIKVDPAAEPGTQKQERERLRTRIEKDQLGIGSGAKKGEG
jgi:hypothetical protein